MNDESIEIQYVLLLLTLMDCISLYILRRYSKRTKLGNIMGSQRQRSRPLLKKILFD